MITSKNNLLIVNVTSVDKNIPVLDCVHIEKDGTTVAGNGKSFITVSPVPEPIRRKLKAIDYGDSEIESLNITSDTAKKIVQKIPPDRKFNGLLEHTDVETNDGTVKFNFRDGARYDFTEGKINPMPYAQYEKLYQRALTNKKDIQLVVNAKRIIPLLETIMKVSNDTSDFSPMFIEFTEEKDIIIRMVNPKTGQRCIGLMWSYKGNEAKWLEPDKWEEDLRNGTDRTNNTDSGTDSDRDAGDIVCQSDSGVGCRRNTSMVRKTFAKRTGDRQLARIIDETCPECGKYHLASDGKVKWCSCKSGCNYFGRIVK